MSAIYYNGQNFEISMVTPAAGAIPGPVSYGGRTCVGIDGAATGGSFTVEVGLVNRILGRANASTDTPALGWHCQIRSAFKTMTVNDGSESTMFVPLLNGGSDIAGNTTFSLVVKRAGSVYTLYARAVQNGTIYEHAVAVVAVGTSQHTLDWWIFKDKHLTQWDGGAVTESSYGSDSTSLYLYRLSFVQNTTALEWPFDAFWFGREEYSEATTIDRSTTNCAPDNGLLYVIEKAALDGLVTAGTAYEIAISDGDVDTSGVTVDKDYLVCKVLTGNNGGFSQKVNVSAGGVWTASEWSL